jgi:hypothetical protein
MKPPKLHLRLSFETVTACDRAVISRIGPFAILCTRPRCA